MRSTNRYSFIRSLKRKGFKEEIVIKIGLYDLVTSTTLESNKSHIENACVKLRKYQLATERVLIFLRSQDFHDTGLEMDLSGPTSFPNDLLHVVSPAFDDLFAPATLYRATGVILCQLSEAYYGQLDLFGEVIRLQRLSNLYESIDTLREKYGKHTVFLGASFLAHTHAQH